MPSGNSIGRRTTLEAIMRNYDALPQTHKKFAQNARSNMHINPRASLRALESWYAQRAGLEAFAFYGPDHPSANRVEMSEFKKYPHYLAKAKENGWIRGKTLTLRDEGDL